MGQNFDQVLTRQLQPSAVYYGIFDNEEGYVFSHIYFSFICLCSW